MDGAVRPPFGKQPRWSRNSRRIYRVPVQISGLSFVNTMAHPGQVAGAQIGPGSSTMSTQPTSAINTGSMVQHAASMLPAKLGRSPCMLKM